MNETTTSTDGASSYSIAGQTVTLPVEVRDARMFGAQFFVDSDAAQELIAETGLVVARLGKRRTVCSLSIVEYLDNDLGTYNEVAFAVNVLPHDDPAAKADMRKPVTYIHRLPVDQPFTCEAGQTIWGFPKWMTSITVRDRGRVSDAALLDDGQIVLGLSVRHSPIPLPDNDLEMTCYSHRDGVLRRTPWHTSNQKVHAMPGGARLQLGEAHPMARELRSLGLPRRAFMSLTTGHMSATFGAAEICN